MTATISAAALSALADEPLDWRFKGLPVAWSGQTPAQICSAGPQFFAAGPMGVSRGIVIVMRGHADDGTDIEIEPFRLVQGGGEIRYLTTVEAARPAPRPSRATADRSRP